MMEKREATMRAIAKQVLSISGMDQHISNIDDRQTFINMMAAGIDSGFRAFELVNAQRICGQIGQSFVVFEEPRIV